MRYTGGVCFMGSILVGFHCQALGFSPGVTGAVGGDAMPVLALSTGCPQPFPLCRVSRCWPEEGRGDPTQAGGAGGSAAGGECTLPLDFQHRSVQDCMRNLPRLALPLPFLTLLIIPPSSPSHSGKEYRTHLKLALDL